MLPVYGIPVPILECPRVAAATGTPRAGTCRYCNIHGVYTCIHVYVHVYRTYTCTLGIDSILLQYCNPMAYAIVAAPTVAYATVHVYVLEYRYSKPYPKLLIRDQ